jgi:hypothetical protein
MSGDLQPHRHQRLRLQRGLGASNSSFLDDEQDDGYQNLPAHYPTLDEALDRVAYLKGKGFKARALALVATPTDTAAEFESAMIQPPE